MSFNNQKFALCYQLPASNRWICETDYTSVESIDKRALQLKPNPTTFIPYTNSWFLQSRLTYKLSSMYVPKVHLIEKRKIDNYPSAANVWGSNDEEL